MVRGMLRTSSKTKKRIRTPGGRLVIHYKDSPKKGDAHCAICGRKLHGHSHNGSKTQKRASRPLANLCSRCARNILSLEARGEL
jgi:ribosomal protein L34E